MSYSREVVLTAAPQSLLTILGIQRQMRGSLDLVIEAEGGSLFYGAKDVQAMQLGPGENHDQLKGVNASDIYFRGAGVTLRVFAVQK